jgi:hypothetical protein
MVKRLLLELVTMQLEKKFEEMKSGEMSAFGKGFEDAVRPWALVFMKNDEYYKKALLAKAIKLQEGEPEVQPELRVWFDSIQVW